MIKSEINKLLRVYVYSGMTWPINWSSLKNLEGNIALLLRTAEGAGLFVQPKAKLEKRLASFGAMGAQLRAPLKPLNTIDCCDVRGASGGPWISPPWCQQMPVSQTAIRLTGDIWQSDVDASWDKLHNQQSRQSEVWFPSWAKLIDVSFHWEFVRVINCIHYGEN